MPRNGSGVYSLPAGYAATANATATASQHNTPLEDLADDANSARPVSAGGTGATSAAAARSALGVPATAGTETISGAWTVTANWTFSGAPIFSGAVSFSGDPAFSGNPAYTGAPDFSGATNKATIRTDLGLGGLATLNILDEDDMASNSATRPPSQQSTKAYVDADVTSYEQAWTAVTLGAAAPAVTHNLGAQPNLVWFELKCITADGGYAVDDILPIMGAGGVLGSNYGHTLAIISDTQLQLTFATNFRLPTQSGVSEFNVNPARWEYRIRAVRFR